ncbi:hypothetical protein J4230_00255 [Candidatus Woesearchaeota archaeon]|nr:hypothetical protein [Candidatus Woesearchaeota archaeon]
MTDGKITLKDFARQERLSYHELVRLAVDGNIDTKRPQDRRELEELLHRLDPLARTTTSEEPTGNSGSDTKIVMMRIPGSNIYYVTIMKGGKVILTKGQDGNLDLSDPQQGLDEITDILAYSTMLDTSNRIDSAKKKKTGKKGKPTFKPTKDKPGYVRDQALDTYLIENADALAFFALANPEKIKKTRTFTNRDDLEEIINDPAFLETATNLGLTIEVESITSYVAKHRGEISRKTKRVITEIIEKEDIRKTAGEVLLEYIIREDREKKKLRELCEKSESVLPLYKRFIDKKISKRLDDKGEHFVICFRQLALDVLYSVKRTGIEMSKEDFKRYISSTAKWVAYAKAADYIKNDEYIQKNILPKLRTTEDERSSRDKIFEAVSDLGRLVIDPDHSYDKIFFRFLVAGLWMEGVMEKETDKGSEPRTIGGAMNEYTDGIGNLIERYDLYDRLLKKAFVKQLEKGVFDEKKTELNTQGECSTFGRTLYDSLLDKDKGRFTSIRYEERPLTECGTYLVRLLRSYIGINRQYFVDEIEKRTGENKDAT